MQKLRNKNKGFTIIEVVLVLAIAGLIFLIVFLALPRLQRNRRDTQRKSDLGTIVSQLDQRAGNAQGAYPVADDAGFVTGFAAQYLQNLNDPTRNVAYVQAAPVTTYGAGAPGATAGNVRYANPGICDPAGTGNILAGTGRQVAVSMRLESGVACQGNQ